MCVPDLNPELVRELRSQTRRPRFLLLCGLSAAAAACAAGSVLVPLFSLPSLDRAWAARHLLCSAGSAAAVVLGLAAAAATSGAISLERERRTLEALLATRLTPGEVVLGKLVAGLMGSLLVALSALPVAGCISVAVHGLPPSVFCWTCIYVGAYAGFCGALGLWISTWVRTSAASTAVACAAVLYLCLGTAAHLRWVLPHGCVFPPEPQLSLFSSPLAGLSSLYLPGCIDFHEWTVSLLFYIIAGVVLLAWAAIRVTHMRSLGQTRGRGWQ